jgi:hypothetical protein
MEIYTFPEMADMHLTYGEGGGNASELRRHYVDKFPNRQKNYKIFFRTDRKKRLVFFCSRGEDFKCRG